MARLRCPICKKPVESASELAPFCSERCRLLDLGNWASERYVIRTPMSEEDIDAVLEEPGGTADPETPRDSRDREPENGSHQNAKRTSKSRPD